MCYCRCPRPHHPVDTNGALVIVTTYDLLPHAPTCRTPASLQVWLSYFWKSPHGSTSELTADAPSVHVLSSMLLLLCLPSPLRFQVPASHFLQLRGPPPWTGIPVPTRGILMILPGLFPALMSNCWDKKHYSSQSHSLFHLELEKCSFSPLDIQKPLCGPLGNSFYLPALSLGVSHMS